VRKVEKKEGRVKMLREMREEMAMRAQETVRTTPEWKTSSVLMVTTAPGVALALTNDFCWFALES